MSDLQCRRKFVEQSKIEGLRDLTRAQTESIEALADVIQAAGNDTRLKILWLLTFEEELCPCDLADVLDLSVPAISQQLQKLRAQRLVTRRRDGVTIYYALAETPFTTLLRTYLNQQLPLTVGVK